MSVIVVRDWELWVGKGVQGMKEEGYMPYGGTSLANQSYRKSWVFD